MMLLPLAMATDAVFLLFHVKALLPVVALAAEVALGDLAHIHLVGALGHLENLVMAARAFQTLAVDVLFVAENDRRGILGCEGQVSTPDLLGKSGKGNSETSRYHRYDEQFFHNSSPLGWL